MKPETIYCPCGKPCGRRYPDTRTDPGFDEGIGENYVANEQWHCSAACAEKTYRGTLPTCEECDHPVHAPGECQVERGDGYRGAEYKEALGPCSCGAPDILQRFEQDRQTEAEGREDRDGRD